LRAAFASANGTPVKSVGVAVGIAIAMNDVDGHVNAYIESSTADAEGDVVIDAFAGPNVYGLAIGIAATYAGGLGATGAVAGAGSGATNKNKNRVHAYIKDSGDASNLGVDAGGGSISRRRTMPSFAPSAGGYAVALRAGPRARTTPSVSQSVPRSRSTRSKRPLMPS
jgi:hypothetical protein